RGREIHRLGDVNGDGWEDLIEWGELFDPTVSSQRRNAIFVTSGRDGSVISASPPMPFGYTFQTFSLKAAGDVNQDSSPDYAVGVYDALLPTPVQWVEVRSGANHSLIWSSTIPNAWSQLYGWAIGADMDLDGDGFRDLVVSATQASPLGTLFVYDHLGVERY